MKILNLYAGIGGNRKLWDSSHEVVAVEHDPEIAEFYSSQHPEDEMIVGDAHRYLLHNYEDFDFIWSSPPCQTHSTMAISGQNRSRRYPDMSLYEEIIYLRKFCKTWWIVENVKPYYGALLEPITVGRHLFWSNFEFEIDEVPTLENNIIKQNLVTKQILMDWLGIHLEKNIYYKWTDADGKVHKNHCPFQVLRNAVHPLIGLQILQTVELLHKGDTQ
jgi:DNA (cytosine-5)-methyltransferase 1